jgi:methylated-DNA-protein-cysteine methyltransferase-like protein
VTTATRTDFASAVLAAVRAVERGDVATYGEIAAIAGRPGAARGVGAVLAGSGDRTIPWWRVVNSAGRLAPGKEVEQARRLRADGVAVRDGRVVGFRR